MLHKLLYIKLVAFTTMASCGVADAPTTVPADMPVSRPEGTVMLGDTPVRLQITSYGPGPVFVALHENEYTSVEAVEHMLPTIGGTLIRLRHDGGRNVVFYLDGSRFQFDPNRIFTPEGMRRTLGVGATEEAIAEVYDLATQIVQEIGSGPIVALHNNTDGGYSTLSYVEGGSFTRDAAEVYQVSGSDPDDFYFTTDPSLFTALQSGDFNAVLQADGAIDDGSLSIYAAQYGIPYVNVEAQHGSVEVQQRMLQQLRWISW